MLSIKKSVLFAMMLSSCCDVWGIESTPVCPTTAQELIAKAKEACENAITSVLDLRNKQKVFSSMHWITGKTTKNKCLEKAKDQQKLATQPDSDEKKLKKYQACYFLAKISAQGQSNDNRLLLEVKECGNYTQKDIEPTFRSTL